MKIARAGFEEVEVTWRGLPFHEAITTVAVLLGFAILFGTVAVWRFDWEEN